MKEENPTSDLSRFGFRELAIAGDLLKALSNGTSKETQEGEVELGDGVQVMFNLNSGNVFLCDEDFNVAMFNEAGKLEMFVHCHECGEEGFGSEDSNLAGIPTHGSCVECTAKNNAIADKK